ncbi:hypothetical protein F3Y22_tig00000477pilonHSYRG00537 [Hibiscus syriacus]|uniref:Uncharacterized protein n=1 Tax=Hibiscus syriacus TaxID=106335 RepID=A0A6A3D6U8_HIBSY|nr:hypothetical protein F3Y22_tig00000477pilonHSYRG00537 [Hibiscus syriacus]
MEDSEYGQYFSNLERFRYHPGGDADDDEELKNPEYNCFIENLKQNENGESYSVEFAINSDISIVLREKAKVLENSGGFSGKARANILKTRKKSLEMGDKEGKKSLGDVPGQKRKRDDENELEEGAEADPVSCKSSAGSSKLMNCVVKAENQPEVPDSFDKSGMNPELGNEAGEGCGDGIRDSSPSQFREKLMDLLKIPYNRKELDNLRREVTKRKPVQGVKE